MLRGQLEDTSMRNASRRAARFLSRARCVLPSMDILQDVEGEADAAYTGSQSMARVTSRSNTSHAFSSLFSPSLPFSPPPSFLASSLAKRYISLTLYLFNASHSFPSTTDMPQ